MSEVPIKNLTCSCCGNDTKGRQWYNRDIGYGLCHKCVGINNLAHVKHGETDPAFSFGVRGYHWGLEDNKL